MIFAQHEIPSSRVPYMLHLLRRSVFKIVFNHTLHQILLRVEETTPSIYVGYTLLITVNKQETACLVFLSPIQFCLWCLCANNSFHIYIRIWTACWHQTRFIYENVRDRIRYHFTLSQRETPPNTNPVFGRYGLCIAL